MGIEMGFYIVTIEQSTFRGCNSSAPPPNVWLRNLAPFPVCPWPIVSREKDNILATSAGRRGILYLPYVYLACVPFYVDQKRVLYWFNYITTL
jgi:hypothetical protein